MSGRDGFVRRAALLLLPVATVTAISPLFAGDGEMGFTNYYFTDSGANKVVTTSFNLARKLLEQTTLLLDIELDHVTVPPITAVTGASRPQRDKSQPFEKSRGQVILGMEQGIGQNLTLSASFYRSQEVDYISSSAVGTASLDMFRKNTTLTLRGQYNADKVGKILESGDVYNQNKFVYTGAADLTQVLSPTTVLDLAYDVVRLKGLLSDPYLQVSVIDSTGGTVLVDELHPDNRTRHAGTARLSQFIPSIRASLIGSYRYYWDTWSVKSHTAELKLNKYITSDLVFSVDYRYYTQTGSWFYQPDYIGSGYTESLYRTVDYKLTPFSSNNFGLSLSYTLRALGAGGGDFEFLENSSIELTYFRYFNTLDFSADIVQFAIKFSI
ncbi:MAG TPA: DUF3570 domain-containing protein [Bacteroidota bacterium]|nr:DUF3570 domain-containing protein [Bacteroidota bacterium]